MNRTPTALLAAVVLLLPGAGWALSITDQDFDQIAGINALGGSVSQIGGSNDGGTLLSASNFGGPISALTGVDVTLPGYTFVFDADVMDGGSTEPGNFASVLLSAPTDITFTQPGSGGPDGTAGDGSLQLLGGGTALLNLGSSIVAATGEVNDIFFFTDTASGGDLEIELWNGEQFLEETTVSIFSVPAGSGIGGVLLDVTDGLEYTAIRLAAIGAPVEIDAVAVAPEPSAFALLLTGVLALLGVRRLF